MSQNKVKMKQMGSKERRICSKNKCRIIYLGREIEAISKYNKRIFPLFRNKGKKKILLMGKMAQNLKDFYLHLTKNGSHINFTFNLLHNDSYVGCTETQPISLAILYLKISIT